MKQQYSKITLITFLFFSISCMFINYITDPFFHFHKPYFGISDFFAQASYQRNQYLGKAKHFSYEAPIIGTSVSVSYNPSIIEEATGHKSINLSILGAVPYDNVLVLNNIFASKNKIKEIYFGIDPVTINMDAKNSVFSYSQYLLNDNPLYLPHYLLNKEISLMGLHLLTKKSTEYPYIYKKENLDTGIEAILKKYHRPPQEKERTPMKSYDYSFLTNIIKAHPDVSFKLIYSPYSIIYWDYFHRKGLTDTTLKQYQQSCNAFKQFPNVEIYDFAFDRDIIRNFSYYTDYAHFHSDLSDMILRQVVNHKHLLSDCNITIQNFETFIKSYDFNQYFN